VHLKATQSNYGTFASRIGVSEYLRHITENLPLPLIDEIILPMTELADRVVNEFGDEPDGNGVDEALIGTQSAVDLEAQADQWLAAADDGQSSDQENTYERLAKVLRRKQVGEMTILAVVVTFDYDENGEPRPLPELASESGMETEEFDDHLRLGAMALEGDAVLDDPSDPFPQVVFNYYLSDKPGELPSRQEVLRQTHMPATAGPATKVGTASNARIGDLDVAVPNRDLVRTYLNQIGKIPLLSAVEEVELATQIEAGLLADEKLTRAVELGEQLQTQLRRDLRQLVREGHRARDRLLESNLRLVVSVAKRYTGRGMPFLDLIQEGNVGLVRAVEKFDYQKGNKFSTYAVWWIRQAVSRSLSDKSRTIRLPVHVVEEISLMSRTKRKLAQELGHPPSLAETAAAMGVDESRVVDLQNYNRPPDSLDRNLDQSDGGGSSLGDQLEDTSGTIPDQMQSISEEARRDALAAVLSQFTEREERILKLRYGFVGGHCWTLDEIGAQYGVTRERIRQIETKVMTKLREPSRSGSLRDFLD
jgi:RNA polymerase primary sigma factor